MVYKPSAAGLASLLIQGAVDPKLLYDSSHHPVVDTTIGSFVGLNSDWQGVNLDSFRGIPFALPPLPPLRYKAPVPAPYSHYPRLADKWGLQCSQPPMSTGIFYNFPPIGAGIGEDCLNLNVFRPPGVKKGDKLPMLVWIYGGGFSAGATSQFEPEGIIGHSQAMGSPILFASINYRLNTFGFLVSDATMEQDLNAGILDQNMALKWLKDNANAFGADPEKITIFGESAGGISVGYQLLYGGDYFRAAQMDSGNPFLLPLNQPHTFSSPTSSFNKFAQYTGCKKATAASSLACLSSAPYDTLYNATIQIYREAEAWTLGYIPFAPVLGNNIDMMPMEKMSKGLFRKVPVISGSNRDEGTLFTDPAVTEAEVMLALISNINDNSTINPEHLAKFESFYTESPADGSPWGTGDELWGFGAAYKRAAAMFNDFTMLAASRLSAEYISDQGVPTWTFLFNQSIGYPPRYGFTHATEVPLFFGAAMLPENEPLMHEMIMRLVSFVVNLDPNPAGMNYTKWENYSKSNLRSLQYQVANVTMIDDTERRDRTDYVNSIRAEYAY